MIGILFLGRVLQFALAIVLVGAGITLIVWLLNTMIQFTANQLGYEVKDFFGWFRDKLPKRKKK